MGLLPVQFLVDAAQLAALEPVADEHHQGALSAPQEALIPVYLHGRAVQVDRSEMLFGVGDQLAMIARTQRADVVQLVAL